MCYISYCIFVLPGTVSMFGWCTGQLIASVNIVHALQANKSLNEIFSGCKRAMTAARA